MTLYLLRVGADSSNGGFFSVIHSDLSYLFIHVLENIEDYGENLPFLRYTDMQWNGISVAPFIPESEREKRVHIDPEFITYTYGSSQGIPAYTTLCRMNQGDILMFYAGFENNEIENAVELKGLYIFAYFVVDSVLNFENPADLDHRARHLIRNNHHFIQHWGQPGGSQVIVTGNPEQSMVLKKAVPISLEMRDRVQSNYYPSSIIQQILGGYDSALNMSSIRTFNDELIIREFVEYITIHGEGKDFDCFHSLP